MGKVQPHEEIGPNNTGKMIIRGICFAGIANHPRALAYIQTYLSARGEVSGISLAEPLSRGMSADEAQFVVNLMAKFKEREFSPEQLPKVTAEDTNKQRDEIIVIAEEELHKFVTAQKAKGKEVKIILPASTIMENVRSRIGVSYEHTLTWEDTGPKMADHGAYVPPLYVAPDESVVKPSAASASSKEGSYVPPPYVPPKGSVSSPSASSKEGSYVPPPYVPPKGSVSSPSASFKEGSYVPPPYVPPKGSVSSPSASSKEGSYVPPPYVPSEESIPKPVSKLSSNEGSYVPPPYVPPSEPPTNHGKASGGKSNLQSVSVFGAHSPGAQQNKVDKEKNKEKEVEEALASDGKKGPSGGPGKRVAIK